MPRLQHESCQLATLDWGGGGGNQDTTLRQLGTFFFWSRSSLPLRVGNCLKIASLEGGKKKRKRGGGKLVRTTQPTTQS